MVLSRHHKNKVPTHIPFMRSSQCASTSRGGGSTGHLDSNLALPGSCGQGHVEGLGSRVEGLEFRV